MNDTFTRRLLLWLALCISAQACPVHSGSERLDDSTSPRSRVEAPVVLGNNGGLLADNPDATQAIVKFGRVDYRLATAPYVGKQARIYYVAPAAIPGLVSPSGLRLEWRGNGLFSDGSARPGERVLVWSGKVDDAWMSEGLDLTLYVELASIRLSPGESFGFESWFEIEVLP